LLIEGDGGFQLNVQELAVVKRLNLPIIMFIINNNGYHSIREMQKNRFDGRLVACDDTSGVELPELADIAGTYEIPFLPLEDNNWKHRLDMIMEHKIVSQLIEVLADPNQQYRHKLKSQLVDGKWQWQKLEEIE
jgi:acetolactate synthase-1/2/3 large subunit